MGNYIGRAGRLPAFWARPCGALAVLVLASGAAHAHLRIDVDKTAQRMHVVVDGVRRHSWPISTGRGGQATPSGRFRPLTMVRREYSRTYDNAPMPYAIYFTNDGHAIHGTKDGLGVPASRGCVRLGLKHAAALFALTKRHGRKKTLIRIAGRDADPPGADAGAR